MISSIFRDVICQSVHPEWNISNFRKFSLLDNALWFFIKTPRRLRKSNFKIIFAPFLWLLTFSQTNLVNLFTKFWTVLCHPDYPNSNISHFHQFSLWCSALWFFIKTPLRVRESNLKINFALSLGSLAVSRPYLVNWYLAGVGAYHGNWCTKNQI